MHTGQGNMGLNLEKSKAMLVSAAEYGHAMSQTELGAMLIDGNGVDSDSSRGLRVPQICC